MFAWITQPVVDICIWYGVRNKQVTCFLVFISGYSTLKVY